MSLNYAKEDSYWESLE